MNLKRTPSDVTLPPRDLKFTQEFVDSLSPQKISKVPKIWIKNDLVETHYYNALSLTFPEGEKFFIEAVRNFKDQADERLAVDLKNFILQEAYHTREHLHFNKHLDPRHYPLQRIDDLVQSRLKRARSMGPYIMLAATTVLEHFTAIMAEDLLKHPELYESVDPEIKRLWYWHALEESEHKAVTYDLWQLVQKGMGAPSWLKYSRRLRALFFVSGLFLINISRITVWLLEADGVPAPKAWWMYLRFLFSPRGLVHRHYRGYFSWLRPSFHPWDRDNREQIHQWRQQLGLSSS